MEREKGLGGKEKGEGLVVCRLFNKVQCEMSLRLSGEGVSERNH